MAARAGTVDVSVRAGHGALAAGRYRQSVQWSERSRDRLVLCHRNAARTHTRAGAAPTSDLPAPCRVGIQRHLRTRLIALRTGAGTVDIAVGAGDKTVTSGENCEGEPAKGQSYLGRRDLPAVIALRRQTRGPVGQ